MREDGANTETNSGESTAANAKQMSVLHKAGLFAGRFRWVICGLLFLGVTKNYMDRGVLGVLKTPLQAAFGWDDIRYGHLVTIFQLAYAAGMLCMGRLIDRLGTRMATRWRWSSGASRRWRMLRQIPFWTFAMARAALGFGEAGVFPASIKSVAEWFPRKSARWRREYLTQERAPARLLPHCSCRELQRVSDGDGHLCW